MSHEGRTILVSVDDSKRARTALTVAATNPDVSTVVVLYVLRPFVVMSVTESAVWDDEFASRRERKANLLLCEYRELVASYGVNVRTKLAYGHPKRAQLDASDAFGADEVIVGRQRKGWLDWLAA